MDDPSTVTALWWAVLLSGLYHGINPGMGWPLAVSSALMRGRHLSLVSALALLAAGHLLALMAILLPFSLMATLVRWEHELRIGAGCLVLLMGIYLLINRKHPRFLARVHPARLALWSFLAALAHGAGLMLVPIYLGLCAIEELDAGHRAAQSLMLGKLSTAVTVGIVHTLAMTIAGGIVAAVIYFWVGLKFLSSTWFNLDVLWALSLVAVGGFGIYSAYQ